MITIGVITTIGVISDTHTLLRPEAKEQLRDNDLIIHAGDIGSADVIPELEHIAPVRAIRGNIDKDAWADAYLDEDLIEVAVGFDVVISGHSHRPAIERKQRVFYLNLGSAGPPIRCLQPVEGKMQRDGLPLHV